MKLTILSNIETDEKGVEELEALGLAVTTRQTRKDLQTRWNPYFNAMWGDFDWLRAQFKDDTDIRAFVTSSEKLKELEIISHIGMYDLTDDDGVRDLYVGVPSRLRSIAKKNGFKTDLACLIVHEVLHGDEKTLPGPDRVHDMQKQGRLKELWKEHQTRRELLQKQKNLLELLVKLYKRYSAKKPVTRLQHPVSDFSELISQSYGKQNKIWYPTTGHHIGTDYLTPAGTPVVAPWEGQVIASGWSPSMGSYCYYEYFHSGRFYVARFMHLSTVPKQKTYKRGQVLGKTGDTGMSTGPHLHAEVWKDEVRLDLLTKDNWRELTVDPYQHYS